MADNASQPKQSKDEDLVLPFGTPEHKFMLRVRSQDDLVTIVLVVEKRKVRAWNVQPFEYVVKSTN